MPVGQPPDDDQDPPAEDASVVDPKVLAERRARRAEMAEESLLSRVNRAEQDRMLLATRLAEAEHALDAARRERDALQEDLDRRERALRAAEQREFSEQQRRVEAEDEAVQARREMRGDVDALRRQIAAAEERADELATELEQARRQVAEAARSAAQDRARSEQRATGGGERRALLAEQEAQLSRRVDDVQRQQREAAAAVRRLEAELAAERERADAEVTLLQHELDRRTLERDEARAEQLRLDADLQDVQAQSAAAREAIAQRDRLLADAERTVVEVRGAAAELARRLEQEQAAWQAQERELLARLEAEAQRPDPGTLQREAALRTELELQRRAFDARTVELEASLAELRAQARAAAAALETRVGAERAAKEAAVAELDAERAQILEQRLALEERSVAERRELDELRRRVDDELLRARAHAEDARAQGAEELDRLRAEAALARREAADAIAAREVLQAELRRRIELEEQVRVAIGELRGRLDAADAQEAARSEREAAVESLVAELVDTATELRAGFERELAETERRLQGEVEEERTRFASELASMEERVGNLRTQLGTAADELREQLEAEQAARWAAEAELAAERERGRADRGAAADAQRALAERVAAEESLRGSLIAMEEEVQRLRATEADVSAAGVFAATAMPAEVAVPAPDAPLAPEAEVEPEPGVEPEPDVEPAPERPVAVDPETSALIADLQRAADRLRAQVAALEPEAASEEPAAAVEPEPEAVEPEPEAAAPEPEPVPQETAPPAVARPTEPSWAVQQAAAAMGLDLGAAPPPPDADEPIEIETAPQAATGAASPAATVLTPRAVDLSTTAPWIARVLPGVVAATPEVRAGLVGALLPAQAQRSGKDVVYDLVVDDVASWRVTLRGGTAAVDPLEGASGGDVDFAIAGSLQAVAPLLAGGAGRKLPDTRISGRRRRARRLLKDLRRPVGLQELAALGGSAADPGLLLELLVAAVDPAVVPGHDFTVTYDVEGPGIWHVRAAEQLSTGPGPGDDATAVVHVTDRSFVALLAGAPLAPGERAVVDGAAAAVRLLHEWFDVAQGIAR